MSILQAPRNDRMSLKLTSIINEAKQLRSVKMACLKARAEVKLQKKVKRFLRQHEFQAYVKRASERGENSVDVIFDAKDRLHADLTAPMLEEVDTSYNLRYYITHNQFLEAVEAILFEDDAINGGFLYDRDEGSEFTLVRGIHFEWEDLTPLPLVLDLVWDNHLEHFEFEQEETVGEFIQRMGLTPRDGTPLVVRHGNRVVGMGHQVSRYFGQTITIRPQGFVEGRELEGVDL